MRPARIAILLFVLTILGMLWFITLRKPSGHRATLPGLQHPLNSQQTRESINSSPVSDKQVRSAEHSPSPAHIMLVKSWHSIPLSIAVRPPAIGLRTSGAKPLTFEIILADLAAESLIYSTAPEDADREKRAWGVVQVLDSLLVRASKLPRIGNYSGGADPQYYFPTAVLGGVSVPEDPDTARQYFLRLLDTSQNSALAEITAQLPPQHCSEGIEVGVRCRAMAYLSSLGHNDATMNLLRLELTRSNASPSEKCTAFLGLLTQGDEASATQWLDSQTDPALHNSIIESLAPAELRIERTSDPNHSATWGSLVSTTGRTLDTWLINKASGVNPKDTSAALASALAARIDNPAARRIVIDVLREGSAESRLAILRERPNLTDEPEYGLILKELIKNPDARVRAHAINRYSYLPAPGVRDELAPYLDSEAPSEAWNAAICMKRAGRFDPLGTIELLVKAIEKRPGDTQFSDWAQYSISDLREWAHAKGHLPKEIITPSGEKPRTSSTPPKGSGLKPTVK